MNDYLRLLLDHLDLLFCRESHGCSKHPGVRLPSLLEGGHGRVDLMHSSLEGMIGVVGVRRLS